MTSSDSPSQNPEPSQDRVDRLRAMGTVLRDVTADETDEGWGQTSPGTADARDAALHADVPPHHGG